MKIQNLVQNTKGLHEIVHIFLAKTVQRVPETNDHFNTIQRISGGN